MPRKKITFGTVREMGLALPDVTEGTAYRSPALKVRGKMFACLAVHKSAERDSLVVLVDFDQRAQLIAADPSTYYLTDHYVNGPVVLVRLARVGEDALRDLLQMGWNFVSSKARRRTGRRITRKRRI